MSLLMQPDSTSFFGPTSHPWLHMDLLCLGPRIFFGCSVKLSPVHSASMLLDLKAYGQELALIPVDCSLFTLAHQSNLLRSGLSPATNTKEHHVLNMRTHAHPDIERAEQSRGRSPEPGLPRSPRLASPSHRPTSYPVIDTTCHILTPQQWVHHL